MGLRGGRETRAPALANLIDSTFDDPGLQAPTAEDLARVMLCLDAPTPRRLDASTPRRLDASRLGQLTNLRPALAAEIEPLLVGVFRRDERSLLRVT